MPDIVAIPLVLSHLWTHLRSLHRDEQGAHILEVAIATVVLAAAAYVVSQTFYDRSVSTSKNTPNTPTVVQNPGGSSPTP